MMLNLGTLRFLLYQVLLTLTLSSTTTWYQDYEYDWTTELFIPEDCTQWSDLDCRDPALRNHSDFAKSCTSSGLGYIACPPRCDREKPSYYCLKACELYLKQCLNMDISAYGEDKKVTQQTESDSTVTQTFPNGDTIMEESATISTIDHQTENDSRNLPAQISPPCGDNLTNKAAEESNAQLHPPNHVIPILAATLVLLAPLMVVLALGFDKEQFTGRCQFLWKKIAPFFQNKSQIASSESDGLSSTPSNQVAVPRTLSVRYQENHSVDNRTTPPTADAEIEFIDEYVETTGSTQVAAVTDDTALRLDPLKELLGQLGAAKSLRSFLEMQRTFLEYVKKKQDKNPSYWEAVKNVIYQRRLQECKTFTSMVPTQPRYSRQISHESHADKTPSTDKEVQNQQTEEEADERSNPQSDQEEAIIPLLPNPKQLCPNENDLMVYDIYIMAEKYFHSMSGDDERGK